MSAAISAPAKPPFGSAPLDQMIWAGLCARAHEYLEGVQYALIRGASAMGAAQPTLSSQDLMRAAMSAALLALADNIDDRMVEAALTASSETPRSDGFEEAVRAGIAAALRTAATAEDIT